jgi:hypothetical protein
MTRRTARADARARPAPRASAGHRNPNGPIGRTNRVGAGGPARCEEAVPEAAEARWRLTPKGEELVASLRAADAAGKDRP